MGTKNNPGKFDCYANAMADEPMFVLLARDEKAACLVEEWVRMRELDTSKYQDEKSQEARRCAQAMREWRMRRFEQTHRDKEFQKFRRTQVAEMRPYQEGEVLTGVSVSKVDQEAGSPKVGDWIARNPANHADQWLVAQAYFDAHFERLP